MKYQLSEKQLRRVGESGNFLSAINFLKGLLEKYQGLFFCLELDLEFLESECIVSRQSSKQCKWEISAGDVFFEQLHPYWTPVDYYDSYSYVQFTSLFSKNCISSFTNTFFFYIRSPSFALVSCFLPCRSPWFQSERRLFDWLVPLAPEFAHIAWRRTHIDTI